MTVSRQSGRLYLVGIGPGDPELMTCKAMRILQDTGIWIAPKAKENGVSSALHIAASLISTEGKTVLELCFPMKKIRLEQTHDPEVLRGWQEAASTVLEQLDQGHDVAFPTLGDPALYSTAFYLLHSLRELRPDVAVSVIPGVTAMSACSAQVGRPLGLGDDVLTVVPAAFDDQCLRDILQHSDAVALMKIFRQLPRLIGLLEELNLLDKAVIVERCGMADQRIYSDIREAAGQELHYFSTLLVRKKQISKVEA